MNPETTPHKTDLFSTLGAIAPIIRHMGPTPPPRPGFEFDPSGMPRAFNYDLARRGHRTPPERRDPETRTPHFQRDTAALIIDTPPHRENNGGNNGGGNGTPPQSTTDSRPIILTSNPDHRFDATILRPIETQLLPRAIQHKIISSLGGTLKELRTDTNQRTLAVIIDFNPGEDEKEESERIVQEIIDVAKGMHAKVILLIENEEDIDQTRSTFAPAPEVFEARESLPINEIKDAIASQVINRRREGLPG